MATIEVDGKVLEAEAGEMLIAATDRAGIYIPRFCYHEKLSIAANCRMCLVEVEKAPKPLPACATPVSDGMKVFTASDYAREAQKGTLEFLLINHPLDCPVCDQGGECPLQDQAMGYGKDESRFMERKRAVASHDIGPLVATEMTRCIHCTRCVRFGEEVAGVMEMGAPGRGEFTKISTFLNRSIDSEVSGNIIDLCPVGALTSRPYRFAARSWELGNNDGISPHDCLGTNINVQTLRNRVERVLPIENPDINECWLADRDRYSYEAVNSENRLTRPMIRYGDVWKEVDWEVAIKHATAGLQTVLDAGSGSDIGALAGYACTLEEYFLLQKLLRGVGSNNIDHRLQQSDFRHDDVMPAYPATERPINRYDDVKAGLLVGSNIRKEQPLLALRLRQAALKGGARISAVNPVAYEQNFPLQAEITTGQDLPGHLAAVALQVARASGKTPPANVEDWASGIDAGDTDVGAALVEAGADGLVVLGALAQQHPQASVIHAMAQWICEASGGSLAHLAPGNSAAAWLAGCVPGHNAAQGGLDAHAMLASPRQAYLLLGSEPECDAIDGHTAGEALRAASFVVQITPWKDDRAMAYADVLLPMAAFTESAGTYVSCEGRVQAATAAAPCLGESRPAWKILRVLGNFLDLEGFDHVTLEDVREDLSLEVPLPGARLGNGDVAPRPAAAAEGIARLVDMPMYRGDIIVRNAAALQQTADNPAPAARMNAATLENLGLAEGDHVVLRNGRGSAALQATSDSRIPAGHVYVPAGHPESAGLGGHVSVTVEKA